MSFPKPVSAPTSIRHRDLQRWHSTVLTINTLRPRDALRSVPQYLRHGTGNRAATSSMSGLQPPLAYRPPDCDRFRQLRHRARNRRRRHLKVLRQQDGFLVSTLFSIR